MSAFANLKSMYIQYWIEPALEMVSYSSLSEVRHNLPIMRKELQAIENQVKFGTFVDPQQIIFFKYLLELINNVPGRVEPEHVAEFKQLAVEQGKEFVAKLTELSINNPNKLRKQIGARFKEEQEQANSVQANTRELQAQREAVAADLYDPQLSSAEREQMRKYGIHPATRAAEARMCITLGALYQDVYTNLDTSDADVIKGLNDRFKQITVKILRLGNLDDRILALDRMLIVLENFKVLFSGRVITIENYINLPLDVKEFLFQHPYKAMPFYGSVGEKEFILITRCLVILQKIDKLENLDSHDPKYSEQEQDVVTDLIVFQAYLKLPIMLTNNAFGMVRGKLINLINIFKSNVISYEAFRALNTDIKELFSEKTDEFLLLMIDDQITLAQLQNLESLLPTIFKRINDIRDYCKNYELNVKDFFNLATDAIKMLLTTPLLKNNKHVTFRHYNHEPLPPLFTAIKNRNYPEVYRLIGNTTILGLGASTNILSRTKEGISYYTCALQSKNVDIIATVFKAIIAASAAKLLMFLRANGFTHVNDLNKVDLNKVNAKGETPLTCAIKYAQRDQTAIILGLLTRDANIHQKNLFDEDPIVLSSRQEDQSIKNDVKAAVGLKDNKKLLAILRARIN